MYHLYLYYHQEDDYQVKNQMHHQQSSGSPARDSPPRRAPSRDTYCYNFLSWSIKVHQCYDGSSNSYGQYGQSDCFLGGHEAASLPLVLHAAFKHAVVDEFGAAVGEAPLLLPHPIVKQWVGTIQISDIHAD